MMRSVAGVDGGAKTGKRKRDQRTGSHRPHRGGETVDADDPTRDSSPPSSARSSTPLTHSHPSPSQLQHLSSSPHPVPVDQATSATARNATSPAFSSAAASPQLQTQTTAAAQAVSSPTRSSTVAYRQPSSGNSMRRGEISIGRCGERVSMRRRNVDPEDRDVRLGVYRAPVEER